MANKHNGSDPKPVWLPVASAKAVNIGDLVAQETDGTLSKASEVAYDTSAAVTRVAFAAKFAGMSSQLKEANKPVYGNNGNNIRIATAGRARVTLKAGSTPKCGDLVGPTLLAGNVLSDQIVEVVSALNQAIGRVTLVVDGNGECEIEILSTVYVTAR